MNAYTFIPHVCVILLNKVFSYKQFIKSRFSRFPWTEIVLRPQLALEICMNATM